MVLNFAKSYYGIYAKSVLLCGSQANNLESETSDFDVIILSDFIDKMKNERILFKEFEFDTKIIPIEKLDDCFLVDHKSGKGLIMRMFSESIILKDDFKICPDIIAKCKRLLTIGPRKTDSNYLHFLKIKVDSRISSLKRLGHKEETLLSIIDLTTCFIEFLLNFHRQWRGNSKITSIGLNNINPMLNDKIASSIESYFTHKSTNAIIELVESQMKNYGPSTLMSSGETTTLVENDYLIVKVVDFSVDYYEMVREFTNQFLPIFLNVLKSDDYHFFKPNSLIRASEKSQEVLFVIHSSKEIINKKIKELIEKVNSVETLLSIYFPVNFDTSLSFDICYKFKETRSFLCFLSSLLVKQNEHFNKSNSSKYALEILYEFAQALSEPKEFCSYLVSCWLSKSYDAGTYSNTNQLLNSQKRIESIYEKNFKLQQYQITSLLKSKRDGKNLLVDDNFKTLLSKIKTIDFSNAELETFYLNNSPEFLTRQQKMSWALLKKTLDFSFGILLVDEQYKSYFPYILFKSLK